ncbi:Craniofacial development protein 2 [Merluccius polli]|uniref:Craniofacial development protein 2 n=1 Tax=Merluccius polli TaxID=89951 RepID=A0AA47NZD6_MERPO|nr:Craniofacial development protein 2 [Merluccius polli]
MVAVRRTTTAEKADEGCNRGRPPVVLDSMPLDSGPSLPRTVWWLQAHQSLHVKRRHAQASSRKGTHPILHPGYKALWRPGSGDGGRIVKSEGSLPCGQKHKFYFGTWNVRTLTDSQTSERPERRTAIISRELKRFRIDIAALSETRLADEGQLKEEKGGYTFFWKGKPADEPRIHGVGFAIKNNLVNHLHELPVGISERLMTVRLMLASSQMATVVSAYAPTLDAQQDVKEAFYADLDTILSKVPKEDKLILLGDFNARVGRNHDLWRGTLGREGVGNTNSNGLLLLTKCSEYVLVITNTLFRQKNKFKTSWMHPRSKRWHLIDFVIVRSQDRRDVLSTRAMISADECWTDHRLIRSIMSIHLMRKRRHQKGQTRRRLNIERLGDTTYQQQLQAAISADLLDQYPEDIEKHWDTLSDTIMNSCKAILGHKTRRHQDWYDENDTEIQQLINTKRKTFITWQNDINCRDKREAHAKAKAAVQSQVRTLKNQWWTQKALEIQQLADSGDTRGFFEATRAVYGPSQRCLTPLRSKDGSLLSSKATIDEEVHHRLSCASGAYSKLKKRVFENRDLQSKTKILVYKAVLLPTLLYGSEAWTTYSRHLKALEAFHQRYLRRILRITWEDRRTNTSVLEEACVSTITAIIAQFQLRWTGHVIRMPDSRLPKQVLYSQLVQGKRAPGGQKRRYKDNIKDNLKKCHICLKTWEATARNRAAWRQAVQDGAAQYNNDLHSAAEQKRRRRKETTSTKKVPPKPTLTIDDPCPHCTKVCGSRIGLFAHLKTHKDQEGGQTYSTTSVRR